MRHIKKIFSLLLVFKVCVGMAQTVPVPDPIFLDFLKSNYSNTINASDQLIKSEAASVTGTVDCSNLGISNLEGIQYFTGITNLYANDNNLTAIPDISGLNELAKLYLNGNSLKTLPSLSNLTKLEYLFVQYNQLTSLPDLSNNTNLIQLLVFRNILTSLPELNNLTKLYKLDVGSNKLTSLPNISNLVNMEQLLIWDNMLTSYPDFSKFPKLWRLNIGGNQFNTLPDLSSNPDLKILYIDNNKFTSLPNLTALPLLEDVRLQQNYFSFKDLTPILSYPSYTSIFNYDPQNNFPGNIYNSKEGEKISISSGIENDGSTKYQWYFKGNAIAGANSEILVLASVQAKDTGSYYCQATHPSFPGLTLKTNLNILRFQNCVNVSKLEYNASESNCLTLGTINVTTPAVTPSGWSYELTDKSSGKVITSANGKFSNLHEAEYTLTVKSTTGCNENINENIVIGRKECVEAVITPNNDGENDTFQFTKPGKADIYDKSGKCIHTLNTPGEWNGTNNKGKMVGPGYYIVNFNNGEEFISITIIY